MNSKPDGYQGADATCVASRHQFRFTGPDDDVESEFKADHLRASKLKAESALNDYLKLRGATLEHCDECLRRVREVLSTYEHV